MWGRGGRSRGQRGGQRGYNFGDRRDSGGYNQKQPFRNRRDGPDYHAGGSRKSYNSPGKRLGEVELGITEYVNKDVQGFDGIIKARYSDFQVSEVDVQGNVAKLTDLSVPTPNKKEKVIVDDQADLTEKYNTELVPLDIWNDLTKMNLSKDENHPPIYMDVTDVSKEVRTSIYDAVSNVFGTKIDGKTEMKGEKKNIVFSKSTNSSKVDMRVKWNFPQEYVHFIVHKENLDTMDAAQIIADALRINYLKPAFFGYSGTKDRRAKTSQWFSLRKIDPMRISNCARRLRNIFIGNFEFKNYHLTLGYLKGNAFRIALRNIVESPSIIDKAVESLKEHGFLNYYGLQRFGSRADVPTYKIGQHLLKGEFREAIDMILTPQGPFAMQLKCYQETKNVSQALSLFPKCANSVERKLLMGLSHHAKNDLVSVLECVPRNMRLLYIHSFQSWIWNRCVSERIKRFGFEMVVGDLVTDNPNIDYDVSEDYLVEQWDDSEETHKDDEEEEEENNDVEENKTENVETIQKGRKGMRKYPKVNKTPTKVKEVTEEDLLDKKYNIYDLVLPLPGYDIVYPSNMKDFYHELTTKEGVDLNVKQKVKSYNLSGTYRKVLIKPQNVSWKHVHYDDPFCDLIQSDWDELKNRNNVVHSESGKYRALILELTLGSSTYATMALRELLKHDTSCEYQAKKNDYHIDESAKDANVSGEQIETDNGDCGEKRKIESDTEIENKKAKVSDD